MEMTKNGQVELDGVIIPYYQEGGELWYPIRYITEQFLLKGASNLQTKNKYKLYIKKCVIDYTFKGTSPQETNCMNKEGWIKYLSECKLNKNKDENKIKRHNIFCGYIGCDNKYIDQTANPIYDDYINDCINNIVKDNKDIKFRKCPKCGRELPIHNNFYPKDTRTNSGFLNICKMCNTPNNQIYKHKNNIARNIYNTLGNDDYILYKEDPDKILEKYYKYLKTKENMELEKINKIKYELLDIVKNDYENNIIEESDLDIKFILNKYKTTLNGSQLNNNEIVEYCTDNDCKTRPWKYTNYKINKIDYNQANKVFNTYIKENNIIINDKFTYNYKKLLKDSKLLLLVNKTLEFVVQYYNYEFAGYYFKISEGNYYRNKENANRDMKYLIEKDMKIQLEKIPLYITKTSLYKNCKKLHRILANGYLYSSLFEWIDSCYPNKFNIHDFEINPFRNGFDSLQEAQVDEQLRTKLDNVIYNQRNTDQTVKIEHIIPDWIAITKKGCIFIEYFGMYNSKSNSNISKNYTDRANEKMEIYDQLEKIGYGHLYIFPEDLNNRFEGLHKKLQNIG